MPSTAFFHTIICSATFLIKNCFKNYQTIVIMKRFTSIILLSLIVVSIISSCSSKQNQIPKAKYVFFFIGDGMGHQQITATQAYLAAINNELGNVDLSFTTFPATGASSTYAYNRYITGSAAAGTALATGSKTSINTIGLNHDHSDTLYSIAYIANSAGFNVGIATSVSIDHATPAAFYAHQTDRDLYHRIAHDLLKTDFRFFASGGFRDPLGEKSMDKMGNVYELGKEKGYFFTQSLSIVDSLKNSYSSIVYSSPNPSQGCNLKYHIDKKETDVTLADITSLAIDVLYNPNGFFLMVEGGKIDWACHDNDAATTIGEMISFSDAVAVAVEFYKKYPNETLIVVTSDHETGGMSFGNKVNRYNSNVALLANQKNSLLEFNSIVQEFKLMHGNKPSFNQTLSFLASELGIGSDDNKLSQESLELLKKAYNASILPKSKETAKNSKELYGSYDPIAVVGIQVLNEMAGIGWTSTSHTGSLVPIYAIGNGQHLFNGQMDNTDIPIEIAKAMGLTLKN